MTLALAVIVAAAWLTNVPAAIMVTYSLALLLIIVAALRRSPRVLLFGGIALVLGTALAAFYIVPVIYEQRWVDIMQVLSPGDRPQENFLFTYSQDAYHNRFNITVSAVAVSELVMLAAFVWISRRRRRDLRDPWWSLVLWGAVTMLLMLPVTALAWEYLPKLRFVQFPWRWLLCLNVSLALLFALAFRRWAMRIVLCLVLLAMIPLVWHEFQQPWWDNAGDINELLDNQQDGPGYEGVDEYTPTGADPYEVNHDARRVTLEGPGQAQIHVLQWNPESKGFTANMSQDGYLTLRLFNYPAWKVQVNDRPVAAASRETTGQMLVPVKAGDNRVEVTFVRTPDRTVGALISAVTVAGILGFVLIRQRRVRLLQAPS